ncbi:N-acetylmuramoyl-L-alanine amidase [Streptomyces sp. NPDC002790]|uniref:N-acetylmuramoyl-L-alanine amidase n=1 Tax=Streptomyces sp. NPDC002790 TaxID=3154431 RepID=UPI0033309D03
MVHVMQSRLDEAPSAFHAGNWEWNARSVCIEREGFVDDPDHWFTEAAYRASARLAADISTRYDITDPGPYWDWDHCIHLVRAAK